MKKKTLKILTVLFIVSIMLLVFTTIVRASDTEELLGGIQSNTKGSTSQSQQIGGLIVGIVQTIGTIVAVVVVAVLGIKYMTGSTEEKAEYKKTMLPYLVGAIILFLGVTIVRVIYSFANQVNSNVSGV